MVVFPAKAVRVAVANDRAACNRKRMDSHPGNRARTDLPVERRAELTAEDRLLLELRDWLYDGDWSAMLADLTARLAGQPYLYEWTADLPDESSRLARLVADIGRIARLVRLERETGQNLSRLQLVGSNSTNTKRPATVSEFDTDINEGLPRRFQTEGEPPHDR